MTAKALEMVLSRLERGDSPNSRYPDAKGEYWTLCPFHSDSHATNFSVSERGYHCFVCAESGSLESLVQRFGPGRDDPLPSGSEPRRDGHEDPLTWLAKYCQIPKGFLDTLPVSNSDGAVQFHFPNGTAKLRRAESKSFRWNPKGAAVPPLWPQPGTDAGDCIWVCEGETDCIVARHIGLPAFAVTKGAQGTLTTAQAEALAACGIRRVNIIFDVDEAGRKGATTYARVLAAAGLEVRNIDLAAAGLVDPLAGTKDLRDAWRITQDKGMGQYLSDFASGVEPEPYLTPIDTLCKVRFVKASELQVQALAGNRSMDFLPLLEHEGYVMRGWSHLLAGYPKAGKTELVIRLCHEWQGERILFLTEEPEGIWEARLATLPEGWEHVTLSFALGLEREEVLNAIAERTETVVIIDTIRNLLGFNDECDNSEIARVLNPLIALCRQQGKTLLLTHHLNKSGGDHGTGITGGHAFLGVVDVALELLPADGGSENQRKIRGWGRILSIPELLYEKREDGSFAALGSPVEVQLEQVKQRVLASIDGEWLSLKDIQGTLDEPRPSTNQVRNALEELVVEGMMERDPPTAKPGATYRYRTAKPYLTQRVL